LQLQTSCLSDWLTQAIFNDERDTTEVPKQRLFIYLFIITQFLTRHMSVKV